MSEQKETKVSETRSGPRLLPSQDESEDVRYWYLDRNIIKKEILNSLSYITSGKNAFWWGNST